ncbi:hypothetical protein EAT51_04290 [Pseudoxanthomonas winnipegensis]|uniref:hypothetical protein n=1 Tax=Pseudoxanthomonas winnipegensis TaxID=2480810 RepID=UPI00102E005B|nr:hypothetical protein [Pseudoxanthomonas winnipegensis]TAA42925.1 hypothetical protein EAT51_04290 [Pseudoxanthomonas winnipegensis]
MDDSLTPADRATVAISKALTMHLGLDLSAQLAVLSGCMRGLVIIAVSCNVPSHVRGQVALLLRDAADHLDRHTGSEARH